jgi:Na+/H+ antiporter NhaD/arsenite permease-like protein
VGSHLGLSFGEYLINMAPIALLCLLVLLGMVSWMYRREFAAARQAPSPALVARLEGDARIADPALLRKAGLVGLITLVLFFVGGAFDLPPSVIALTGATVLIAWVRPDMHRLMREVDWTTLFFFVGIFVMVAGLNASGVIAWAAEAITRLAGHSLRLATVLMVWMSGLVSALVDNIPYTVAAIPIADRLTQVVAGAQNQVVYWALILGADFGGNATYLGSAPNIVAAGLLAQAGYRVSFRRFARDGVPVTVVTLLLATLYLLVRY